MDNEDNQGKQDDREALVVFCLFIVRKRCYEY